MSTHNVPPDEAVDGEPRSEAGSELEQLRQELEQLREKHLRAMAETRNVQQRATRDKEEALRYAEADFARDLLVVLDDLERTLESAQNATDPRSIAEGVRIIYEQFLKVLEARGIRPIASVGAAFDSLRHQAILQQPSSEHPPGTVLEEAARGYLMHDRVLRPAKVVVATDPQSSGPG